METLPVASTKFSTVYSSGHFSITPVFGEGPEILLEISASEEKYGRAYPELSNINSE